MSVDMNAFSEKLMKISGNSIVLKDESMSKHTTFRTGGAADVFVVPESAQDIINIMRLCREENVDYYVIGKGSNLLVGDKGFRGVIICVYNILNDIETELTGNEAVVKAGAGVTLSKLANVAADNELSGLEFASGIPGTLGGAVTMNAGAYGMEIKDCISGAVVIDGNLDIVTLPADKLRLGYRSSIIKDKDYIVLEAKLNLVKGKRDEIVGRMNDFNGRRRDKQPLEYPSAGSTFKRPQGYFAGKLIQDSGLAGYRVGGASVSGKHCGFVVNDKGATSADIIQVIEDVKKTVYDKFGVNLEPEIKMIGEF